jgi:hypothetical protein
MKVRLSPLIYETQIDFALVLLVSLPFAVITTTFSTVSGSGGDERSALAVAASFSALELPLCLLLATSSATDW